MTDKEKLEAIKAEIHRLVDVRGYSKEMANDIFAFMNSLPSEPVSDDLEEAAKNHAVERFRTTRDEFLAKKCKWSFIIGAKWKEQQMMSRAVDFTIVDNNDVSTEISTFPYVSLGREGDEVKLIVIKQE